MSAGKQYDNNQVVIDVQSCLLNLVNIVNYLCPHACPGNYYCPKVNEMADGTYKCVQCVGNDEYIILPANINHLARAQCRIAAQLTDNQEISETILKLSIRSCFTHGEVEELWNPRRLFPWIRGLNPRIGDYFEDRGNI